MELRLKKEKNKRQTEKHVRLAEEVLKVALENLNGPTRRDAQTLPSSSFTMLSRTIRNSPRSHLVFAVLQLVPSFRVSKVYESGFM